MSYKESKFYILDNTGVKKVKCLKIYKSKKAKGGSFVTVVVKKVIPFKKIKKGQICRAIVVRLKSYIKRICGNYKIKFDKNYVVLLKKNDNLPLGTRIIGPVLYEIRKKGLLKIVSLASYLI